MIFMDGKKEQGRRVIENGPALLIWKHHANNKLRYIVINPCVAAAHPKAAHHVHEAGRNLFVTTFIHDNQNELHREALCRDYIPVYVFERFI